jgi:hypothetical protein
MNNISNVLPMISFEFDTGAAAPKSDLNDWSVDDFASMLASMWSAPATPQQLTAEVVAESDTPEIPAVSAEATSIPSEISPLPVTGDGMIPQPVLTFDSHVSSDTNQPVLEPSGGEQPGKKIALPDNSLPAPKQTVDDESVAPVVIEQSAKPADIVEPISRTVPEATAPISRVGVRNPTDLPISEPQLPKLTVPNRTPPAVQRVTAALAQVDIPEGAHAEVVTVEKNIGVQNTGQSQTAAPDQVTAEAIKREANLVAGYLAQSTRDSRETFESIRAQVSGNGSQSASKDSKGDSGISMKETPVQVNVGSLNFASTLKTQSSETVAETVTPQVANQIADLASVTQPRQQRSVRLRLRPEELGQVDIQLTRDSAGKVSAQVVVEREAARAALTQSLPQLREALERAGLNVDHLNVSSDASSFAGTQRDNQESSDHSHRPSFTNQASTKNSETSKERVREHKLLSLSA